jgi:hypothetical protein
MSKGIGPNERSQIRNIATDALLRSNQAMFNPETVIALLDHIDELEEFLVVGIDETTNERLEKPVETITLRQQAKVRNFGVSSAESGSYLRQKLAEEKIAVTIDTLKRVETHIRNVLDSAFRFFGGINIQDFPMDVQRKYVEQVSKLGKLLRGKAWFESPKPMQGRPGCCTPELCANCGPHCGGRTVDHSECGKGTPEYGPDDPDCACRLTERREPCAAAGCGFCTAMTMVNLRRVNKERFDLMLEVGRTNEERRENFATLTIRLSEIMKTILRRK